MKAEIETKEISGIASAILDMRKPMGSKGDSEFGYDNQRLELVSLGNKDKELLYKLGRAKSGSGHDCVLKDIQVHMDITATHDFFLQLYRYHFRDTASSTSKMHCITKGDISTKCADYVSIDTVAIVNGLIEGYNTEEYDQVVVNDLCEYFNILTIPQTKKELFECIIHNTPLGYMLTVGEVTNYLQLKSMYNQREKHKMSMWSVTFVDWVKTLPMSFLITGE